MFDIVFVLTLIGIVVGLLSLATNVWQYRRDLIQKEQFRHLLPTWSEWADAIYGQTREFWFSSKEESIEESERYGRAMATIEGIERHAGNLSREIEKVADRYLSEEERQEKKARLAEIRRSAAQRSSSER